MFRMRALSFAGLALVVAVAGCGTEPASEGHTPASARLFSSTGELTPTVTLSPGVTVRIEVRFYHDDGDEITGIEDEHFSGLTFSPGTLATVTPVSGHHFQFDVVPQGAAGTGTVTVGYGHDAEADELSFGPFTVTITAP
jgi:hypothetical protein